MRTYTNIKSLEKAIEKKEIAYDKAREDSTRQFGNIGWGSGMRLSKMPSCGFSKEDRLRDDLRELNIQLDDLKEKKEEERVLLVEQLQENLSSLRDEYSALDNEVANNSCKYSTQGLCKKYLKLAELINMEMIKLKIVSKLNLDFKEIEYLIESHCQKRKSKANEFILKHKEVNILMLEEEVIYDLVFLSDTSVKKLVKEYGLTYISLDIKKDKDDVYTKEELNMNTQMQNVA